METPDKKNTGRQRGARKQKRLAVFRYRQGRSFLHRLDPRTKLLLLLTTSATALVFSTLPPLLILFLFIVALALISRLGEGFLQALVLVSPLLFLVIALDCFFSKVSSGPVYFSLQIGILHPEVTAGGLLFALAMGLRLLTLAGISSLFVMTTSPEDLVKSLRSMHVPWVVTFSIGYALTSINTLAGDTRQIMDAQRSRGLELDRTNPFKNRNCLAALFVPVTVSIIRRSKLSADAMLARGFSPSAPMTRYPSQGFSRADLLMGITLVTLIVVLIGINRYLA